MRLSSRGGLKGCAASILYAPSHSAVLPDRTCPRVFCVRYRFWKLKGGRGCWGKVLLGEEREEKRRRER
eukprot:1123878-Rhodomonas_salina.1